MELDIPDSFYREEIMQTKDYSITLDMLRTLPFRPFEIVEGDTGNVLHVTLLNNGDAMDLADCKLCITFASSNGFAMQDETSGIEKTGEPGAFDVALLPTAYGAGNVSADVQVYSGTDDATLITSTRFDFRCRKSLINGDIIHANEAYPPLVEATRIANEAAATALAAAERIDTDIGELNVQANWAETDGASDAYIKNKPAIPSAPGDVGAAPATHASQHGPGGSDQVTPIAHASRHASGGADPVSPASVGAAGLNSYGKVLAEQASARIRVITASWTLTLSDAGQLLQVVATDDVTISIPANADVAFPVGTEIEICHWSNGKEVTIAPASGTSVSLRAIDYMFSISDIYGCAVLKKISTDIWLLSGALK